MFQLRINMGRMGVDIMFPDQGAGVCFIHESLGVAGRGGIDGSSGSMHEMSDQIDWIFISNGTSNRGWR